MLSRFFLIFIFVITCFIPCPAQFSSPSNFKFKTYTTQDGLADNTILKVVKDKRGFLWIATHNGISRFDGLHFKNYTHIPTDTTSLKSIWATDLIVDVNKTLWASTEGGVCYYDEKFDRFRYVQSNGGIQLIYKAPLCNGPGQSLWVAAENGLMKINIFKKTLEKTSLTRLPDPQAMIFDNDGNIIIGTRGFGLFLYNTKTNTTKKLQLPGLDSKEHVMGFYKDEEGTWVATSIGLLLIRDYDRTELFTGGAGELAGKKFAQLMCINAFDPLTGPGKLVCGTYDKNFLLFDKTEKKFIYQWENKTSNPDNVPSGIFYCLYAEEKTFWAGTDYGLCKLNLSEQDFVTTVLPDIGVGKTMPLVKQIIPTPQNINQYWMTLGNPSGGIILYDVLKKKITRKINPPTSYKANAERRAYVNLFGAKSGLVYALADFSIDVFSQKGEALRSYQLPRQAYSMGEDAERNFWIGTESGMIFLDSKTGVQIIYD
ncbi:MAG: two-component regulator propeller domain-containing protein, partial [Chitinophagaceae bacterium]